jgi:hypothetical protein
VGVWDLIFVVVIPRFDLKFSQTEAERESEMGLQGEKVVAWRRWCIGSGVEAEAEADLWIIVFSEVIFNFN